MTAKKNVKFQRIYVSLVKSGDQKL